ncbi:MAG: sugar ABC transporter ATP-binding protein [Actinobacteria bacterium]|nr:MAG: sugar ABC transporter ATP-binding protein [Actinomycetota bacterium]
MINTTPLLELQNIGKYFGNVKALENVSTTVKAGEVTCVLGDNGAGKSTFIKIISGLHKPSTGKYLFEGHDVAFDSPREARLLGIATVYQDLAMAPLMSVWRNFFLGSEPTKRFGPINLLDAKFARATAKEEMSKLGIDVRDVDQPVGTLSGGERQSVAIARAVYFGARVLILDEPTSALGVRQSDLVLGYVRAAAARNLGVILITHNPQHALPVGDRFLILNRGQSVGHFEKQDLTYERLIELMSGRVHAA